MINGVLVETTIEDVVPALRTNADGLRVVLDDLLKQYKVKQDEMEKWKVRFSFRSDRFFDFDLYSSTGTAIYLQLDACDVSARFSPSVDRAGSRCGGRREAFATSYVMVGGLGYANDLDRYRKRITSKSFSNDNPIDFFHVAAFPHRF